MRVLHLVKLVEPLLFALHLLRFVLLVKLVLELLLQLRLWIFVAHGFGG